MKLQQHVIGQGLISECKTTGNNLIAPGRAVADNDRTSMWPVSPISKCVKGHWKMAAAYGKFVCLF